MTSKEFTVPIHFEPDHPAFAGHFPARPIIPGVLFLDQAQRLIQARHDLIINGLPMAKFLSPAIPSEVLKLKYQLTENQVRFEIFCKERRIASGQFNCVGVINQ